MLIFLIIFSGEIPFFSSTSSFEKLGVRMIYNFKVIVSYSNIAESNLENKLQRLKRFIQSNLTSYLTWCTENKAGDRPILLQATVLTFSKRLTRYQSLIPLKKTTESVVKINEKLREKPQDQSI